MVMEKNTLPLSLPIYGSFKKNSESNVYEKSLPYTYFCNGFINITDILYKIITLMQ